jgi:curved DNA-binding protein
MNNENFVDYYEILQVSRNADMETIERVYRLLAKRYHPDNKKTGDEERFRTLTQAYSTLANPEKRAGYDAHYESDKRTQWSTFFESPMSGVDEDKHLQEWILSLLYTTRRRHASDDGGMGIFELEKYLDVAEGQLEFHIWYLKEKGWISRTDSGRFAITVTGVDVISDKNQLLRRDRLLGEGNGQRAQEDNQESLPDRQKTLPREETKE